VAQKKQLKSEPDPHGQLALMLCESLVHELVESGVITKAQALNVVDTVAELVREAAESGQPLGSARKGKPRRSATAIIEAIRKTFLAKGAS
jgi:polyhydroxyalkanoate synthesis regulator phasin